MITVALLAFNRENYIDDSLRAILNQTIKDFELIIIDNHSTDNTHNRIIEIIGDRENTTLVRLGGNSNAAISYHTALLYAKNPFVLITHDDDILSLDYLWKCNRVLARYPNIGLIGSNVNLIDESGKVISDRLYPASLIANDLLFQKKNYLDVYLTKKLWIPTSSQCINRLRYFNYYHNNSVAQSLVVGSKVVGNKYLKKQKYLPSGDIECCIAINELSDIYFFSKPCVAYRQHSGQESRNVEQDIPLLNICRNIEANKYFSLATRNKIFPIKVKYQIQQLFFNSDFKSIIKILKSVKKQTNNPLILVLKYLFNIPYKVNNVKALTNERIYFDLYVRKINYELLREKVIVLVGSMLMAYVLYKYLRNANLYVDYVIDRSPARKSKEIFDKTVLTYEELIVDLSSTVVKTNKKLIFITTSERINDTSIKNFLIEKFKGLGVCGEANIVEWRDILGPLREFV